MYCQTKSVKSTCHSPLETQSSSPRVIQYCIVVCRDVQVHEKLFKILMCQSYNSKVNSFLCYSSIFIMTKILLKVTIPKLVQHYPAVSFPIFVLQSIIPNRQDKTSSVFLITHFVVCIFAGIFESKKKNCLKSYCCPDGQDRT